MQINRLFEIVYILMNKKNITAKELSERFEVSQRTIYRDIETLCQAGIPIYTSKGKGGGIYLMDHFVLNKSLLSEKEQNDILIALQSFQVASYSNTKQVLTKLTSLFGNHNSDWIEVDFSNWSNTEENKNKFEQIKYAIMNCLLIHFYYYNSNGEESYRTLEPRKLIYKGQAWYIYGYCRDKQAYRFFKIARIKYLTLSADHYEAIPIPDSRTSYRENSPPEQIELTLRVDAAMAYRVYDEFEAADITKQEDGSFLLRTKLYSGGWIFGYLMSYEDSIEIIEPSWLREELIERYRRALQKHTEIKQL